MFRDGRYRMNVRSVEGWTFANEGAYEVTGGRLELTMTSEAACAGVRWASTWERSGASMTLSHVRVGDEIGSCGGTDEEFAEILGLGDWTRLTARAA
jgi:hypothetical protein